MTKLFGVGGSICEAPDTCHCGKPAVVHISHRAADPTQCNIEGLCEEHAERRRKYLEWRAINPAVAAEIEAIEYQAAEMERWPAYCRGKEAAAQNIARAEELRRSYGRPE